MRCCVPGCKNDSRYSSKSQGITFHVFPNEPSLRTLWLQALGKKETWEPKERSTVCSEHFLCSDMYMTRNGLRKIRTGAVPLVLQESNDCVDWEPAGFKTCRICLAMDKYLYPVKTHTLQQAYEHLTGQSVSAEPRLPQKLCAECLRRLINCNQFRIKSLRANTLMMGLLEKHNRLTITDVSTINRESNQLASNLKTVTRIDYFDLYIEEIEPDLNNLEGDQEPDINNLECDQEPDINNLEDDQLKKDICNEEIAKDIPELYLDVSVKLEDSAIYESIPEENSDHEDYETSKYLEYSSDDSLPLEVAKLKTLVTKKSTCVRKSKKTATKAPDTPKIDRRRKPFLNDDLNQTMFTVSDLTTEEQIADVEKRQESSNFKNGIFKCMECYKGFLDEDAYNSHMSRHTTECGEHRCIICKTHFKHSHALRKHVTAHHTQRFSCNQCMFVTTHRQSAKLHERWHKGTKYKCPHCPEEFLKFTTYMGHIRIKHPSDFVCQLCGYSFVSEKGIMLHKKLKHRHENVTIPDDGPMCDPCNMRFANSEALKRHMNVSARHQTKDKPAREPNTPKARRQEFRGRQKRRRDEDRLEGPISCEQCGVQLEDSRAYHGHFRRMHPDKNRTKYPSMKSPCMCEVCGRMFQSQALLKDHRWVHTGERPFSCESCGKCFRMKQRLVAHRRVHSDHKPTYPCLHCGKHFSTHSNRQRHMFIHTGLKPFKCEMCGKGFKHGSEKRSHITYVHLKKPWPKRSRGKRRTDGRQQPTNNQQLQSSGAPEMEIQQPVWTCDPKMDIPSSIDDKPFYTLKI